ncbi:predicted protein [Pyrenophora tritici-repentis Pt-1C-BFP]|uniref:Uncharacterized protein n=1 Tax=Pyrenophora tritici-repentis (strain Pt-1C-BFP) TaxID=426418 RepID=B2W4B7_PYRTR|nr:uncharacterized protein PTRG_04467 [Pyrenophora tritici-repentis Pt-1C-BFP]EDU47374.1 predicted protein [Pyrenophora tritici-repentis Pt-1C-BFP]
MWAPGRFATRSLSLDGLFYVGSAVGVGRQDNTFSYDFVLTPGATSGHGSAEGKEEACVPTVLVLLFMPAGYIRQ